MRLDDSAIASLGASLRAINPGLMKSGTGTVSQQRIWYQGKEPYFDVTVEMLDDEITWLQITLRGKVISWRPPNHLQTGETDEMDVPADVAYYAASKTIRDGEQIDWEFAKTIQAILAQRPEDEILSRVSKLLQREIDRHLS